MLLDCAAHSALSSSYRSTSLYSPWSPAESDQAHSPTPKPATAPSLFRRCISLQFASPLSPESLYNPDGDADCTSPPVIFTDEATIDLDAFQAERVVGTLRQLTQDEYTDYFSVHQPRDSVYNKFGDIMLLSDGAVVYIGPIKDELLDYRVPLKSLLPLQVVGTSFLGVVYC